MAGAKASETKVKGAPPRKNKGGNSGRNRTRKTRERYWSSGRLRERKVRALMKNPRYDKEGNPKPLTRAEATVLWNRTRKRGKHLIANME